MKSLHIPKLIAHSKSSGAELLCIYSLYCVLFFSTYQFEFVWDDVYAIENNPLLTQSIFRGIKADQHSQIGESRAEWLVPKYNSYRPLRFVSSKVDQFLCELSPSCMHLHNLFLGAVAILLVYWLANVLHLQKGRFIITLIFAIHPIHVEPFSYISARSDLLAGVFALLTIIATCTEIKKQKRQWLLILIACVAYLFSMMSKEALILLPFAIFPWAYGHKREKKYLIPGLCLLGTLSLWLFVRSQVIHATNFSSNLTNIKFAGNIYFQFLKTFFFPMDCSIARPTSTTLPWCATILLLSSFLVLSHIAFKRRSSFVTTTYFGITFFVLLLAPSTIASSITHIASDRYMFLPMLGLLFALYEPALWAITKLGTCTRTFRFLSATLLFAWGTSLFAISSLQNATWKNNLTLFTHAASQVPSSGFAWYGLGVEVQKKKGCPTATKYFRLAANLNPTSVPSWNNLGVCQLRRNDLQSAMESFKKALELSNNLHHTAWFNLGEIYLMENNQGLACIAFKNALAIKPTYKKAQRKTMQICKTR